MKLTPKEKAKQLTSKFFDNDREPYTYSKALGKARNKALLCVDEIEAIQFELYGQDKWFTMYFLEVREEIQKP